MIWDLLQSEGNPVDRYGLGAFLKRLENESAKPGGPLQGFTFLEDGKRMLARSREIENAVTQAGGPEPLYVGFQNATKLAGETKRYLNMREHGVTVYAFGEGTPTDDAARVVEQWRPLEADHVRLENQWYLVTKGPEPIAFVGWEISPEALWGQGGISYEGKQFVGFISADERVVDALIRHFERVRVGLPDSAEETPGSTPVLIEQVHPTRVLVLVDDGTHPELATTLSQAVRGCARCGATLFLYDLSSASYLTSPYPEGDEAEWRVPLEPVTLRHLGRGYLADLVDHVKLSNVTSRGILPYAVGFGHLATWCRDLDINLVVLPVNYTRPTLFQRMQGFTVNALLAGSSVNVIIDDAVRGSRLTSNAVAG